MAAFIRAALTNENGEKQGGEKSPQQGCEHESVRVLKTCKRLRALRAPPQCSPLPATRTVAHCSAQVCMHGVCMHGVHVLPLIRCACLPTPPQGHACVAFTLSQAGGELGIVILELFSDVCPRTCENFIKLVKGKAKDAHPYKGSPIHRVVKDAFIQVRASSAPPRLKSFVAP